MSAANISSPTAVKITLTPKELSGAHVPAGIGLIAPFDFAQDAEYWRWLPQGTPLYVTRTPRIDQTAVTIDLAKAVSDEEPVITAVGSLLATRPAAVAYACTSGSFVEGLTGEAHLTGVMRRAGAPAAVTSSGALIQALRHTGSRKIAIATPYNESLTNLLADFLTEAGFEVVSSGYFDLEQGIAKIGYDAIRRIADAVDTAEADTIFFSCTNLRTFDLIEELERKTGKTILSANQVTVWAALQAAGIETPRLPQRLFAA